MSLRKLCYLLLFNLVLLVSYNCKEASKTKPAGEENIPTPANTETDLADLNEEWQLVINAQLDSLYPLYTEKAYKISPEGKMVMGNFEIMDLYKGKGLVINDIATMERVSAVLDSSIVYEIGNFSTPERTSFAHLIIWGKEGERTKRELELVEERTPDSQIPPELEERRAEWMSLCNAHKVSDLVNNLYAENTLYYNHKPMVEGREAVIKEYGYMESPDYQLKLEPITLEAVNEDVVFEIGQCSGSYVGNYVLVWKKQEDGVWRILLDSNI